MQNTRHREARSVTLILSVDEYCYNTAHTFASSLPSMHAARPCGVCASANAAAAAAVWRVRAILGHIVLIFLHVCRRRRSRRRHRRPPPRRPHPRSPPPKPRRRRRRCPTPTVVLVIVLYQPCLPPPTPPPRRFR